MTTHETELTEPVDLCTPDGSQLNPAARGWSRLPLHRCNLHGSLGTNKRWDYWAILAGDLVLSTTYSNVDHLAVADVWWADLVTGETGGRSTAMRGDGEIQLPDVPASAPLTVDYGGLRLSIIDDDIGTQLSAAWAERDGRGGRLDLLIALPARHESMNVVIPWSDVQFNYTSKHQARPAVGTLTVGDRLWTLSDNSWGVLDVGRGRWPSLITWNWGGGAGRCDGHVIGLQIGAKWTSGTGHTENGIIVDGRLSKIGREMDWIYDWENPMGPWRVVDPGGQLDMVLTPRYDKHSQAQGRKRGSETHQAFGTWAGTLRTDDGLELTFDSVQGFAEEARQNW